MASTTQTIGPGAKQEAATDSGKTVMNLPLATTGLKVEETGLPLRMEEDQPVLLAVGVPTVILVAMATDDGSCREGANDAWLAHHHQTFMMNYCPHLH